MQPAFARRWTRAAPIWVTLCAVAGVVSTEATVATAVRSDGGQAAVWHAMPLPVPVDDLTVAAGVPSPSAPEHLLFDLIRVIHERPADPSLATAGPLGDMLAALRVAPAAGSPDVVPLPLPADTWARVVFKRSVAPELLAEAILADRNASMLYLGLGSLDAETLAWIEHDEGLLSTLAADHAAVLAAFGRSVAIRSGMVSLPVADETRVAWETLVGASASDPSRFLPALLGRDEGRLAYFFDAIVRLDEPHRRFVMGLEARAPAAEVMLSTGDGEPRADEHGDATAALLAAYEPIRAAMMEWNAEVHPFYRPAFDPAEALRRLRITDEGKLGPPSSRVLWDEVYARWSPFAVPRSRAAVEEDADAAWLLSQWLGSSYRDAHVKLEQMITAQRVFAAAAADVATLSRALDGMARHPALALVLERLGVTDPARYVLASRAASAVGSRASRRDGYATFSLFQGLLVIVERAWWAGTIDRQRALEYADAVLEQAVDPRDDFEIRLIDWFERSLLPALGAATGVALVPGADRVVLSALAGVRRDAAERLPVAVEWEGESYRLDLAAGRLARFARFYERLAPPSLSQALAVHQAVEGLGRRGDPADAMTRLSALLVGLNTALAAEGEKGDLTRSLERAQRALAKAHRSGTVRRLDAGGLRDVQRLRTMLAADVVRSLAYLPSLGDPEGAARLGGDVARRHRFDIADSSTDAEAAWSLPHEHVTEEDGWHVRGSLLGLDVGLARLALRRLDVDRIPLNPSLDEATRRRFAVAVVLARPGDVTDELRDWIGAALAEGRARVAQAPSGSALDELTATVGLDAHRRNAFRWAVERLSADPLTRLSLAEVVELGANGPLRFDMCTVPSATCLAGSGACGLELSDLALRLVGELAARDLPVALLPGLLESATQDMLDDAQLAHAADEPAIWDTVRRLQPGRIDDHIAALAGPGPLVFSEAQPIRRSP